MIKERIEFELKPTFCPPENLSGDALANWHKIPPAGKRKAFMLQQLDTYGFITMVSPWPEDGV